MGDLPQVTVTEVVAASTSMAAEDVRRKKEIAGQEKAFESKYGMAKPKSSDLLRRRLSKGGKGQYFDSGDYNMQGGRPGGAQRSESQLKSAPAVTPGAGGHAASLVGRRPSQPSKLGAGGQVSPTAAQKPVATSDVPE